MATVKPYTNEELSAFAIPLFAQYAQALFSEEGPARMVAVRNILEKLPAEITPERVAATALEHRPDLAYKLLTSKLVSSDHEGEKTEANLSEIADQTAPILKGFGSDISDLVSGDALKNIIIDGIKIASTEQYEAYVGELMRQADSDKLMASLEKSPENAIDTYRRAIVYGDNKFADAILADNGAIKDALNQAIEEHNKDPRIDMFNPVGVYLYNNAESVKPEQLDHMMKAGIDMAKYMSVFAVANSEMAKHIYDNYKGDKEALLGRAEKEIAEKTLTYHSHHVEQADLDAGLTFLESVRAEAAEVAVDAGTVAADQPPINNSPAHPSGVPSQDQIDAAQARANAPTPQQAAAVAQDTGTTPTTRTLTDRENGRIDQKVDGYLNKQKLTDPAFRQPMVEYFRDLHAQETKEVASLDDQKRMFSDENLSAALSLGQKAVLAERQQQAAVVAQDTGLASTTQQQGVANAVTPLQAGKVGSQFTYPDGRPVLNNDGQLTNRQQTTTQTLQQQAAAVAQDTGTTPTPQQQGVANAATPQGPVSQNSGDMTKDEMIAHIKQLQEAQNDINGRLQQLIDDNQDLKTQLQTQTERANAAEARVAELEEQLANQQTQGAQKSETDTQTVELSDEKKEAVSNAIKNLIEKTTNKGKDSSKYNDDKAAVETFFDALGIDRKTVQYTNKGADSVYKPDVVIQSTRDAFLPKIAAAVQNGLTPESIKELEKIALNDVQLTVDTAAKDDNLGSLDAGARQEAVEKVQAGLNK